MSHGWLGLYHGVFYGFVMLAGVVALWHWRRWYVSTGDGAQARRSLWQVGGAALVFCAMWLTCGRVSMRIDPLAWAVPPVAAAGVALLAVGLWPARMPR